MVPAWDLGLVLETLRARISNPVSGGQCHSPQSSHHPQEVLLAQFSLYVHKGGLKPDSFNFIPSLNLVKDAVRRSLV